MVEVSQIRTLTDVIFPLGVHLLLVLVVQLKKELSMIKTSAPTTVKAKTPETLEPDADQER